MKHMKPLVIAALAALPGLFGPALAGGDGAGLPPPLAAFEARYLVSDGSARVGKADIGLEPTPEGWRYYSRVKPEGLYALLIGQVKDTAWLERHEDGLRPLRFVHEEADGKDNVRIEFDWSAGEAEVKRPDGNLTIPLAARTHDQFSAMLVVMQEFASGSKRLELPSIDDGGESERLTFAHGGTTSITTPYGTFETIHVQRVRTNSKRETESWLAPSLDWVPVRIDQRRKGKLIARMELIGINGDYADLSVESQR